LRKLQREAPRRTPERRGDLRHSVATDLRELGKTDREIADILGQRTAYATPTYHRSTDMKRSNARVIGDLHGEDRSEEKSNLPP
jgi:integrase